MSSRSPALVAVLVAVGALVAATVAAVVAPTAHAADTAVGTFYPVTSRQRVLDTRTGLGARKGVVGADGEIAVTINGAAGIPRGVAGAVVLNLTGVGPSTSTYLTAYPSRTGRPATSTINLTAGLTRANLTTVPVGTDGAIRIYNNRGSVHVVADVLGYYARTERTTIGSQYYTGTPTRIFDSRTSQGGPGPLAARSGRDLYADYGTRDNPSVVAVVVNVIAVRPASSGYLVAWSGTGAPISSTLNFRAATTVSNVSVVPTRTVGGRPTFSVANGSSGRTDVVVDLVGVYLRNQSAGLRYAKINASQTPTRIVDTRNGTGGFTGKLAAATTRTFTTPTTGSRAVAGPMTYALIANLTVTAPTSGTYLTVWTAGTTRPRVSSLNAGRGTVVANATMIGLSNPYAFAVYNDAGSVNAIVDVTGRFDLHRTSGAAAGAGDAERTPVSPGAGSGTR